jgi:hypothetical protein
MQNEHAVRYLLQDREKGEACQEKYGIREEGKFLIDFFDNGNYYQFNL